MGLQCNYFYIYNCILMVKAGNIAKAISAVSQATNIEENSVKDVYIILRISWTKKQ